MEYVKEDYLLGNKKIIVGDRLHDLVLENLGKIYIRYGSSYKEFNSIINSIGKATVTTSIKIEEGTLSDASTYGNSTLVYCVKDDSLYLVYNNEFLTLAEAVTTKSSKYVKKSGDTMTGRLTITCDGAPLNIVSTDLVENLNANYLEGKSASDFAKKHEDENITGDWTFSGETTFDNEAEFNAKTAFNKTATFNATDGTAAIRIGTGNLITDGSLGSSQYASGMSGYGWRLDANTNTLEIDNLIVRGVLSVFELVVNKISATNGSLWITDSFEVKTVHDLEYIEVDDTLTASTINTLSTEKYYIPYKISDAVKTYVEADSFENTIFPETKPYNYYLISINKTSYPTRDGSNIINEEEAETFFRFHFAFKILDKDTFCSTIRGKNTTAKEIEEAKGTVFHYDTQGYLRDSEDNYYTLVYNDTTDTYILEVSTTDKAKMTDVESAIGERGTAHFEYLSDYDQMTALAQQGVIEKINLYQKYPQSLEDYEYTIETVSDDNSVTSLQSIVINPEFDKHYYSIITSNKVVLDSDYGYYASEDIIRRVNLYYKYFGERMTVTDSGYEFPETKGLYIVEAENGEYPVFHAGDILRCQKFTGTSVKQYNAIVLGNVGSWGFIIQLQQNSVLNQDMSYKYDEEGNLVDSSNSITSTDSAVSQTDTTLYDKSGTIQKQINASDGNNTDEIIEKNIVSYPEEKDAIVRIGSILDKDRQNSMLLTSSESYSPFADVLVGINRPDYGVIYFTPKYKTFTKTVASGDTNVEKSFYIQNDKFGAIMELGNLGWNNADQTLKDSVEANLTEETWNNTYLPIYTKYKDISVTCSIPEVDRKNASSLTKPVKVSLTYQENDDAPSYYDEEGNRIKVSIDETYVDYEGNIQTETVKYYTSSKEARTIITPYSSGLSGSLDCTNEGNSITLTVGTPEKASLVNVISTDDAYTDSALLTEVANTICINKALLSNIQVTPWISLTTYNEDGTVKATELVPSEESVTVQLKVEYAHTSKVYNLVYGQTYDLLTDILTVESAYPQKMTLTWVFGYLNQNLEYSTEIQILSPAVYATFTANQDTIKTTTIDVYSGKAYVTKWGCLEVTNDFDEILKVPITLSSGEIQYHYSAELVPTCRTRMGNLGGIYNETFGKKQPKGYGFYGENVYLTGNFYLDNGRSLVDISDDILLAVGSTNKIKEDLETLADSVKANLDLIKNDQASLKSGLNTTIKNYISTNKNSVLKIGLDYSLWALGNAGLSLINPNATYSYDSATGNYNVDEATVGDGDEYLALQGNSIYFNINKSSGNYYYVVCTLTDPNTWIYGKNSIYVPYDSNEKPVKFFLGYVSQSVLQTSSLYQVQTTSSNKEFLRYVGLPTDLDAPTAENLGGTTTGIIPNSDTAQAYSFNQYYINTQTTTSTNNIQYLNTDGEYADYYTLNTGTSTVYFVKKVDTVGLFDSTGKFNTNLIQLNTLIAIKSGYSINPDFKLDEAVSLLGDNLNYPVVDANNNPLTDVPYVIISGTSGLLSANRANLSGSVKIGNYYEKAGQYIYLTDNETEGERINTDTSPALYLVKRSAGIDTITASFSSTEDPNPVESLAKKLNITFAKNSKASVGSSNEYTLHFYTRNGDFSVEGMESTEWDKLDDPDYTPYTGTLASNGITNDKIVKTAGYKASDQQEYHTSSKECNIVSDGSNTFTLQSGERITLTISYNLALSVNVSGNEDPLPTYASASSGIRIRDDSGNEYTGTSSTTYIHTDRKTICTLSNSTETITDKTYSFYLESSASGSSSKSTNTSKSQTFDITNDSGTSRKYSIYIYVEESAPTSYNGEQIENFSAFQTSAKNPARLGDPYDYLGNKKDSVYAYDSKWSLSNLPETRTVTVSANYTNINVELGGYNYTTKILGNGALFGYNPSNYFTAYRSSETMVIQYAAENYGQKFAKNKYYDIVNGASMPKFFPIFMGYFDSASETETAYKKYFNDVKPYFSKVSKLYTVTGASNDTCDFNMNRQISNFLYKVDTNLDGDNNKWTESIYYTSNDTAGVYVMRIAAGTLVIAFDERWKDYTFDEQHLHVYLLGRGIHQDDANIRKQWCYCSLGAIVNLTSLQTATISKKGSTDTSVQSTESLNIYKYLQIYTADDESLNDASFYLELRYCPNSQTT